MKACTMANGAVFFVPDVVERKSQPVSYADLAEGANAPTAPARKLSLFDRLMKRDRTARERGAAAA
jgi:hypothetical protein